jgi:SulP family sulfate permease
MATTESNTGNNGTGHNDTGNKGFSDYVPGIKLITDYDRSWWRPDILAALSLWAILVPQAMAYAQLAGVPAVFGLYTAIAAMVAYAFFGSSRELNQGPESAVAILTASMIAPIAGSDPDRYLALAAMLALLVGAWCIVGGLLRLGFITKYLSRPILLGYILGSAVLIVVSQLPALFGLDINEADYRTELGAVIRNLDDPHLLTFAIGVGLIALIYLLKHFTPKIPAYLVAAVVALLLVWAFDLAAEGVAIIGDIQSGLPRPGLPDVGLSDIRQLLFPALAVALLAYADSVVTAQSIARMQGYDIDANQEFFGLGSASIASGLFRGFPVNGSQTRTVVLQDAGVKSQMAGLISAGLVILTLLFLTGIFENLPDVALAAIVIVAGIGLFDIAELRRIWEIDRTDAVLAIITAVAVVGLGMLSGIVVAILLSLLEVAWRAGEPRTAILARVPGTDRFRDIENIEDVEDAPGIIVYRFDAPLFFANVGVLTGELDSLVARAEEPVRMILIDAESIYDIDSTAVASLYEFISDMHEQGIPVSFARVRANVYETMEIGGITELVGQESFHLEVDDGVDEFLRKADEM